MGHITWCSVTTLRERFRIDLRLRFIANRHCVRHFLLVALVNRPEKEALMQGLVRLVGNSEFNDHNRNFRRLSGLLDTVVDTCPRANLVFSWTDCW